MKRLLQLPRLLLIAILFLACPLAVDARSYSSGGGHSYSSHSSSHSSSSSHSFSSPSHSFSSGGSSSSSHSSSSGSSSRKSSSSSGKSYSSGSSSDDSSRHSYSSGKSYNSGSSFSSSSKRSSSSGSSSSSASDDFHYDTAAAHARKEEASKDTFAHYNQSQNPSSTRNDSAAPPIIPRASSSRAYRDTVYVPDTVTLSTRPVRVQTFFHSYYLRPVVYYHDPYSSLFWWWLLDQSLDNRAMWAYNHRADMDAARYQALLDQDAQLQARVTQLEAQQTPADPSYVPTNMDRDLMYSDEHLQRTYSTRPTTGGSVMFMLFAGILVACAFYVFIWLVFFHRWQTSSQSST